MLLRRLFSRRWWMTTLLVIGATLVLIRLGIWQLNRLETRRAMNAHYTAMQSMTTLDLNAEIPESLMDMEYRSTTVTGTYDFENQIAVRNQYYGEQYGYHLLTPLLFEGTAVLVDRGWIPADGNSAPDAWRNYDVPGTIAVEGVIRLGRGKPAFGGSADALPPNRSRLEFWNNADVVNIAAQLPYPIVQIYIQPINDPADATPPIPSAVDFELTEGSHFGYALQWFTFAALLFFGYPYFIRKQDLETP